MSDPDAHGTTQAPDPADRPPTDTQAGRITVTMGPHATAPAAGGTSRKARPQASSAPATEATPPPPQHPPGVRALIELQDEMRKMRKAIDGLAARVDHGPGGHDDAAPDASTPQGQDADADLKALAEAVRTLEAYVSLTFFDRVHASLREIGEADPRPAALERHLVRLRRLVWLLGGAQVLGLVILALLVASSPGTVDALSGRLDLRLDSGLEVARPAWEWVIDRLGIGADPAPPPIDLATGS